LAKLISHTLDYEIRFSRWSSVVKRFRTPIWRKSRGQWDHRPIWHQKSRPAWPPHLIFRFSLFLESGDIFPDGDEHIVEFWSSDLLLTGPPCPGMTIVSFVV
jgi:hypothetical protein